MHALTRSLGEFAAGFRSAPAAATATALTGITDAVGLMLAAAHEPVVRAIEAGFAGPAPASGRASLLLSGRYARVEDAALLNAVAAHAFAMDDVAAGCHPSAILMPALLAQAEAIGASGERMLRAYVVGYEILAELAEREPDALHATGWHPTGVLGPVAVAGAVANLQQLDAEQCTRALAIAASMSGGLIANFGTQAKALHAGRTAQAGVLAARWAAAGVTASIDALESATGLLPTLSPAGRVDLDTPFARDADALRIVSEGLSIKKYPVCYSTHRVVDAAASVARQPGFAADAIERVQVRIGSKQAWMARNHTPQTPLEAKYSVEFAVAAGLLTGDAGFAQLEPAFIRSAAVQRLMAVVELALDERANPEDPIFGPDDRVVVHLRGGTVLDSGDVRYARGHARLPLTEPDLRRKFLACVASGARGDGQALYSRLRALPHLADVRLLTEPD